MVQTWQIEELSALSEIDSSSQAKLDAILSDLNAYLKRPAKLSLSGLTVTIGDTEVTTGPDGKKLSFSPLNKVDIGGLSGTIDFSAKDSGVNGPDVTGDIQAEDFPVVAGLEWIHVGFELRDDKKIYLVPGTPNIVSTSATTPLYSSGALPLGEIFLQAQTGVDYSGTIDWKTPADSSVLKQYLSGSGGGSSAASSSGRNFFGTNYDFEEGNADDWDTGNSTLVMTAVDSSPLSGTYSGLLTATSGGSSGNSRSRLFTIPDQFKNELLSLQFEGQDVSGYTSGYLEVMIYDVLAASVIESTRKTIPAGKSRPFELAFMASNSSDYRLRFEITAAGGGQAFTYKVDDIKVDTPVEGLEYLKEVVNQTAHGFTLADIGTPVYLSSGDYLAAQGDASNTAEVVGLVSNIVDADNVEISFSGVVRGLVADVFESDVLPTVDALVYLSTGEAGKLTVTAPTVVGQIEKPLGYVSRVGGGDCDIVFVNMRANVVGGVNAIITRTLSNNASTTIKDFSDMDAGRVTGFVFVDATTDLRAYYDITFTKNGAGEYQATTLVTGTDDPADFSMSDAGVLSCTLLNNAGFTSARFDYQIQAPGVGANLPTTLELDSLIADEVETDVIGPRTTDGTTPVQVGKGTSPVHLKPDRYVEMGNALAGSTPNLFVGRPGTNFPMISRNIPSSTNAEFVRVDPNDAAVYCPSYNYRDGNYGASWGVCPAGTAGTNGTIYWVGSHTPAGFWKFGWSSISSVFGASHEFYCGNGDGGIDLFNVGDIPLNRGIGLGVYDNATRKALIGAIRVGSTGTTSAGFIRLRHQDGTDNIFWVDSSNRLRTSTSVGSVGGTGGTVIGDQTSDERLKENIEDCPYGLSHALALKPIRFEMNGETRIGFGAQTTQGVVPEVVHDTGDKVFGEDEPSKLSMSYSDITAVAIQAIKEQQAIIEALQARIEALENK